MAAGRDGVRSRRCAARPRASADGRRSQRRGGSLRRPGAGALPVEGIVRPAAEGGYPVALSLGGDFAPEAYAIRFAPGAATLKAGTRTGLLYGLITLGQILRGARRHPETFLFPAEGEIRDAPALGWRGTHLDVARQFYGSAEIARFLRILAWNKLNRFHWHLSDDEAWRVEIEAYPELTEIGAWRGHGRSIPALLGSGAEAYGGYYSKAAIREIVALAGRLGIEVVPEIDVPGHCYAMLQAMPRLRDPDETGRYFSVQGFPNNCLNPAREETYTVLEAIFDELIDLFPFKTIHIGADEVPLGAWSGSPQALAMLRETAARRRRRPTPNGSTSSPTPMAPTRSEARERPSCRRSFSGASTHCWPRAAARPAVGRRRRMAT